MPTYQCRDFQVAVLSIFKDKDINPLIPGGNKKATHT